MLKTLRAELDDWRSPIARAKNAVAAQLRRVPPLASGYEPLPAAAKATKPTDLVTVEGDMPPHWRRRYVQPRPAIEVVGPMIYTPSGHGVLDGRIVERASVRAPSIRETIQAQRTATRSLSVGTVLEMETPYTYGDWVGDAIRAVTTTRDFPRPLVLPRFLGEKGYVRRDLERLGVAFVTADEPVLIERASVLRKQLPSYDWSAEDVVRYREVFGYVPEAPRPGSLLYLARFDTPSEAVQRRYPSERVAQWVEARGGLVFDTRTASPTTLGELSPHAETVIADQGSAVFGVMQWRTRTLIELFVNSWWHSANLFIAEGAGVERYVVLDADGSAPLEDRLDEMMGPGYSAASGVPVQS